MSIKRRMKSWRGAAWRRSKRQSWKGVALPGREVTSTALWCSDWGQVQHRESHHKPSPKDSQARRQQGFSSATLATRLQRGLQGRTWDRFSHVLVSLKSLSVWAVAPLAEEVLSRFCYRLHRFSFPLLFCTPPAEELAADSEGPPASLLSWQVSEAPLVLHPKSIYRFNQQSTLAERCGGIRIGQQK